MATMVSALRRGVTARLGGCQAGVPHLPAAATAVVRARARNAMTAMVSAWGVGCLRGWVDAKQERLTCQRPPPLL